MTMKKSISMIFLHKKNKFNTNKSQSLPKLANIETLNILQKTKSRTQIYDYEKRIPKLNNDFRKTNSEMQKSTFGKRISKCNFKFSENKFQNSFSESLKLHFEIQFPKVVIEF